MKYKFIGENNSFCLELVAYKIKSEHSYYLFSGDVITVPDDNKRVIGALDASPVFVKIKNNSKKNVKKEVKK